MVVSECAQSSASCTVKSNHLREYLSVAVSSALTLQAMLLLEQITLGDMYAFVIKFIVDDAFFYSKPCSQSS
jgi:hypothetical protein